MAFSRDRRAVLADQLHTQVDVYLGELQAAGVGTPPNMNGRALCVAWMNDQWLYRTNGDAGEEYSLTSHALEARDIVSSLTRERALISESRLNTILHDVRRWALEASPDAASRIDRLTAQIDKDVAERDRLAAGGDVLTASDDRMLEGYMDLVNLIGQLPSDFKRVEESVLAMHREILQDFRDEERPIGEVLDEYLTKSDDLVLRTIEGRAFDGAFALLRDEVLLMGLRRDLRTILDHPFSAVLDAGEISEFRGTVAVIRQGTEDVLAQRRRLTSTLREHIVNHDVVKERELDQVLKEINRELAVWMRTAGPQAKVPIELMPATVAVGHLRERFYDPQSAVPPPPLEDVTADAPEPLSMEEIRKQGGPSLADLRRCLADAFATGDSATVGAMFNALPDELRRPVEILGLLHVIAQTDALDRADEPELFNAIRPDGSHRQFLVPGLALTSEEARMLHLRREEHPV
jgi:hypothetical protein